MKALRGPRGQTPLERWAQHVAQALVVAGVLAGVSALWQMNGNIESILVEIKRIKSDVADHEDRLREIERAEHRTSPSRFYPQ